MEEVMKQMWRQVDTWGIWVKGVQVWKFGLISKLKGLCFCFIFKGEGSL